MPLPPLSHGPGDEHAPDGAARPGPDPALDDAEAGAARAALAQGRRQAARALLLRTGDDWDRRAHRITVLAHEPHAAARAAEQAPADSPLAILPVVAHAERYRVLAAGGFVPCDPVASAHWRGSRARDVMKAAFDWLLEWEHDGHPRRLVDLNHLAHAKVCEGRGAEAAALFRHIGPHVTPEPWSYPDRDPHDAFRAARADALGLPGRPDEA
ncbi:hypothetical protein [Streptomyces antibioticus]|uniref:hypothetical protein n=1 Tax=Streptomyces antibioticus TaxID=1890 RepID=UPI003403E2F1